MDKILGIPRAIVRAAMQADGWKVIGRFDEVEGNECGSYVLVENDFDHADYDVFIACLDEEWGDIYFFSSDNIDDHEDAEKIKTLISFYIYEGRPASDFREALVHRYPYGAGASDLAIEYIEDYYYSIEDGSNPFPTSDEWDEIEQECIEDAAIHESEGD